MDTTKRIKYIRYINANILPFLNYKMLDESYKTDMIYAKGILNRLHEGMIESYGSEQICEEDGADDGLVLVPGVLQSMVSGEICLALFDLDLESGGELWGTDFLCFAGFVSQDNEKEGAETVRNIYVPYNYCHTADIPCDYHVKRQNLSEEMKTILKDFRNHKVELGA
ncbi:hypothetical protein FACS189468_2200 [Spirochaetia bacterium]|nr:hypothetical protein FACS189468_2200 [Spirochaetia bacterium]